MRHSKLDQSPPGTRARSGLLSGSAEAGAKVAASGATARMQLAINSASVFVLTLPFLVAISPV